MHREPTMIYQLPPLPYPNDALEPFIDARTKEIHHARHHAGYVSELNKLLDGQDQFSNRPLEEIIADIRMLPEEIRQEVRNNGGGHLNHSLLWHVMSKGKGGEPDGILGHTINGAFGSFVKFKEEFAKAAIARVGSGWAWLCVDSRGRLEVFSTPNEDSPIMLGSRPVLGVDLWEHAYYLKYQDRRLEYIDAWWNTVNWDNVAELYSHCLDMVARTAKAKQ
jgi:superoxide dismutase, Fe-Mn family